ncbi:MAG: hypothetical protein IAF02_23995, partial [Anaerolineae bacterium]|nr:hypothetical protein [Anaerolineae bacterium]
MESRHPLLRIQTNRLFLFLLLLLPIFCMMPSSVQADVGIDGNPLLSGTVVLNRYARVSTISGNTITVENIADLNDGGAGHFANESLSPGDLILIYQAQGASFTNSNNDADYGSFAYQNAGHYEFAIVASVSAIDNQITIDASNTPPYACSGLSNTYSPVNGRLQVVRVPQYTSLTIDNGTTVTAVPWNGTRGGIVALHVQYDLIVNGAIDASGMGFRGGDPANAPASPPVRGITSFRTSTSRNGGEKGESILGDWAVYDLNNGRYARGAPANGGGGGNAHNAGGGGGANGTNGSGAWIYGQGFVAPD